MNNVNLLLSQNSDFKFVGVKFYEQLQRGQMPSLDGLSNKTYHYKTTLDLEVGDKVIVDTPSGELKIVEVVNIKELHELEDDKINYKWIVSKVDLEYYHKCKDTETEVKKQMNKMAFNKQREEYKAQLQERLGPDALITLEGLVKL